MEPISTKFNELNPVKTVPFDADIAGILKGLGIINLLFFFVGIIFMGSLIAAGYGFVSSSGSPEGIGKANQRMINSLLGLSITFGAFIIVRLVLATIGAGDVAPF